MKVALVYDRVNKIGGAERVLKVLHELWPKAPLYTALYNPETAPWADSFEIRTSFLQKIPGAKTRHQWLAWLAPLAFESFDFSDYQLVISVTSAEAKGIITPPGTIHICYCLTPTRYLWSGKTVYEEDGLRGWFLKIFGTGFRVWDFAAAQRPDQMVAISQTVKKRISKYYRRPARIIYPPLETNLLIKEKREEAPFYLLVSRLVKYKRVDLAIKAFNQLGKRLVIVGQGEEERRLKALAKSKIIFVGQLTDEELVGYYQSCRALIFPSEEDFGLVSLEAQAMGRPVIGYIKGGAAETIIPGKTGLLFSKPTTGSLVKAVRTFESKAWQEMDCRQQAKKFSKNRFKKAFKALVEEEWHKHQQAI